KTEGEIRLLGAIIELGGGVLQPGEMRDALDRRVILAKSAVERESADQIAAMHRNISEQQSGGDGMVEARNAVDRLAHQIAGIESQDNLMIALGIEFFAQQFVMPRRMLPVDEAAVVTRHILAQRV